MRLISAGRANECLAHYLLAICPKDDPQLQDGVHTFFSWGRFVVSRCRYPTRHVINTLLVCTQGVWYHQSELLLPVSAFRVHVSLDAQPCITRHVLFTIYLHMSEQQVGDVFVFRARVDSQ